MQIRFLRFIFIGSFFLVSITGFSQGKGSHLQRINSKTFTHTFQTQLGFKWVDGFLGNYDFWANFLPSYEIGYQNKYFAKLRYVTFYEDYRDYNVETYLVDYAIYKPMKYQRFNLFSLVLSYNLLNPDSDHILKVGADLGYGVDKLKFRDNSKAYFNYMELGFELSYKYFFYENFGIGAEANFGYVFGTYLSKPTYGIGLTFSYRF